MPTLNPPRARIGLPPHRLIDRRRLLQWPLALGGAAALPTLRAQPGDVRLALVVGNRQYPSPHDLPSIHKNVHDLSAALEKRGFAVTSQVDLDAAQVRQAVDAFAKRLAAAPDDTIAWFYFSGHGQQLDAENLLVGAGVNPQATPDAVQRGSATLAEDVVARLPRRPRGLTVAVIDACRTDLRAAVKTGDGLNQVEAPPGCLIAFSTGAGRPALAPNNDRQNTFYTAELIKHLASAPDELSFSDLFRLVKLDTQATMQKHPVALVRQFTQFPFIAENTAQPTPLARRLPPAAEAAVAAVQQQAASAASAASSAYERSESSDWSALQAAVWPADVLRLAEAYMQQWPNSAQYGSARVAAAGAAEAQAILARNDVRLYRRAFDLAAASAGGWRADLLKAARGDKDAAARIGRQWRTSAGGGAEVSRYEGWMQYAAELGNGIASYELALHYRRQDQPQPAARWESRSRELGYTPPPSLDNRRK